MYEKSQMVTLQARVTDAHDRSNITLTVDDPENTRDTRDNHFTLTARALDLACGRAAALVVGGSMGDAAGSSPESPTASAEATTEPAPLVATVTKPAPTKRAKKTAPQD